MWTILHKIEIPITNAVIVDNTPKAFELDMSKVTLELVINPSGNQHGLYFWDSLHGDDIACDVEDGKLMLQQYKEVEGEWKEIEPKEVTLLEFIEMVKERTSV